MTKYKYRVSILLMFLMAVVFSWCNNTESKFTGSKTCNDDQFLVDFEVLNKSLDGNIVLLAGDVINVTVAVEEGSLDISIKDQSGNYIYKGNDVETAGFSVKAEEDGEYTCTVSGDNAKGFVHFIKVGAE